jgi:hypothetical protein
MAYQQAVLPIQDEATYTAVLDAVGRAFSVKEVDRFLDKLKRNRLRARQFEAILASGLLGAEAQAQYARLGDSDRGHIREEYLSSVERVAPELRARHLKVYAYY